MVLSFIFATDLHGSRTKMTSLVKKAIEEDVDMVLLGGDLFRSGSSNTIDSQRRVLNELQALGDIGGKLLISHTPPAGTLCDMGHDGEHLGFTDLREHVLEQAPEAVLSGHIHESPAMSGRVLDRLGGSIIANPGSVPDRLSYIGVTMGRKDLTGRGILMETHIVK
ncbi:MAG: metallophosphoesterase [Thermoplasmatota archaeon]